MFPSVEEKITNLNNRFNTLEKSVKDNFDILGNEMVQLSANLENNKLKNNTNKTYIEYEVDDIEKQIEKLIDITDINIQSVTFALSVFIISFIITNYLQLYIYG
jgi:predicted PurR-regulated permease PerM